MTILKDLSTALSIGTAFVPRDVVAECRLAIEEQAQGIFSRPGETRSLEHIIATSLKGTITEIGISLILEQTKDIWPRFSLQADFMQRLYDIAFIRKIDFQSYNDKLHKLEVKTSIDNGRYLEFNKNKGRRGLSLQNFIDNAKDTEFLVTASVNDHTASDGFLLGYDVTPHYVFHRDAFNKEDMWDTKISTKPDSILWYNTAISKGLCLKIQ